MSPTSRGPAQAHHPHPAGVPPTCPSPHWGFTHLPVLPLPPPHWGPGPPAHVHIPPPSAWPPAAPVPDPSCRPAHLLLLTVPSVLCSPHGSRPDYFPGLTHRLGCLAAIRPWPGSTGERLPGMDSAALSAQPAAITALRPGSLGPKHGHLFQTRAPVSCCHTCSQSALSQRNPRPSVSACSPSAVAQTQVHSHVLFHAPMLCESERRCPAPRDSGCEPTPAHPQMGWAPVTQGLGVCSPGGWRRGSDALKRVKWGAESSSEGKEGKARGDGRTDFALLFPLLTRNH